MTSANDNRPPTMLERISSYREERPFDTACLIILVGMGLGMILGVGR